MYRHPKMGCSMEHSHLQSQAACGALASWLLLELPGELWKTRGFSLCKLGSGLA